MSAPDYSLRTVVTDTFTAPRWVHHLVKLGTGLGACIVYGALVRVAFDDVPLVSVAAVAFVLSLGWFLSLRIAAWLDHRDAATAHPFLDADLSCDTVLHVVASGVLLLCVAHLDASARLMLSIGWLTLCGAAYLLTYPWASP